MSATSSSAILARRLEVDIVHSPVPGYFRSKLYIAPYSSNPLIAAAGPLFTLLERLSLCTSLPNINNFRQNIEHELYAFLSRLHASNYAKDSISVAHYLIGAAIDEMMAKNYLSPEGNALSFQAFTPISNEQLTPDKGFFEIIHFVKERPNQYLDIIELCYYCLISGFEGKFHQTAHGRNRLDNLIDELYLIIQNNRVSKPAPPKRKELCSNTVIKNRKPLYLAMTLFLALILSGFSLSQFFIDKKANALLVAYLTPIANG